MTHDQLFVFREILLDLMEQLKKKGKMTCQAISESYALCPDQNERASLESDRSMLILLGERERRALGQITTALARLENGTYGICEECGEEIPLKRLQVQPTSTLCVCCKEYLEKAVNTSRLAWV